MSALVREKLNVEAVIRVGRTTKAQAHRQVLVELEHKPDTVAQCCWVAADQLTDAAKGTLEGKRWANESGK